jgi:hypothetical protein
VGKRKGRRVDETEKTEWMGDGLPGFFVVAQKTLRGKIVPF